MLQAWTMRGLKFEPPPPAEDIVGQIFGALDEAGFTSIVATNSEQEYLRYLRPGDHLTRISVVDSISEEKKTGLGAGHFVTWRDEFRTDNGELVGTMMFRVLKFRPSQVQQVEAEPAAAPAAPRRPRPAVNDDNRFFWDAVARGELRIQRCASCGKLRHPPRPMCPKCQSLEWDTIRASGKGTVHSYVVPYHPQLPMFPQPYIVVLVDLAEGTRLVSNLIDIAPEEAKVGMPVELVMVEVEEGFSLPLFRPR